MNTFAALSSPDKSATRRPGPAHLARPVPIHVSPHVRRDDTALQRKAACACGGGCPRCSAESGHADRVATTVMRMLDTAERGPHAQRSPETRETAAPGVELSQVRAPFSPTRATFGEQTAGVEGTRSQFALQLASDPSPPPEFASPDREEESVPQATGGPIEDTGEGIAELEEAAAQSSGASDSAERGDEEEQPVQTRLASGVPAAAAPVERVASQLGGGRPLAPPVQRRMERFFGHDFSRVRVHADERADSLARTLDAHAFTVGDHVAFATSRYQPESSQGARLLVHELSHVVQQSSGLDAQLLQKGIGSPGDRYEQEADSNADRFARGESQAVGEPSAGGRSGASIQRHVALQLYSGSAAAAYARKWALGTNSAYLRFGNDCTNFVSQSTEAGGWTMLGGSCKDRTKNSVWWYGSSTCWWPGVRASYTWAGAQNFHDFTSTSGRGTAAGAVADLNIGDVLQMKFDGSTNIGHSMVVTDKKNGDVFLSYHTSDHLDEPFWAAGGILDRYPTATYYGWKL